MSKRYIDVDLEVQKINETLSGISDKESVGYFALEQFRHMLEIAPTADVVEVRHGYWYIREYEFFTCSECGHDYYNGCDYTAQAKERLENGEYPNYCPNCGADMRGKNNGQE